MDLLTLQGQIKRDPDGYADEFRQQYRHYKACLEIFKLKPTGDSKEFAELVSFIAQVAACYPRWVIGFAAEISGLLEEQAEVLDPALRLSLVRALILMRNKGALSALEILPTLFRLFRCHDKTLKQLLFRHIIADIKSANRKHQDNKLNRGVQAFLYGLLQADEEAAALRALAVLTELHRRNVWRDARTVNVIATAAQHPSSRVMLASLKFFLGQDDAAEAGSDDEGDGPPSAARHSAAQSTLGPPPAAPTSKDVYSAKSKGTNSSKRKKAAKLKRVMQAVKKHERREAGYVSESFAAIQLLHDPQEYAERLFARLLKANERLETRLCMMSVISRAVGVHKLQLLNFYPFLQKYIQPHQRDVTQILAILVQAVHELVPPDALEPVLKQLADQFINDRTRPEAMAVGLKTVRELAARSPLIITPDLLQDLVQYRKYKHKEVSGAARALLALFRQLDPSMLAKKDRGKGANLGAKPLAFGDVPLADRIEGVDLLQAAELRGSDGEDNSDSDGDNGSGSEGDDDAEEGVQLGSDADSDAASGSDGSDAEGDEGLGSPTAVAAGRHRRGARRLEADFEQAQPSGEEPGDEDGQAHRDSDDGGSDVVGLGSDVEGEDSDAADPGDSGEEGGASGDELPGAESGSEPEQQQSPEGSDDGRPRKKVREKKRPAPSQADSLKNLKKQFTEAKAARAAAAGAAESADPLEWGRILTEADFERIKELRHEKLTSDMMARHGMRARPLGPERLERLREAAQNEAEEMLEEQARAGARGDDRVRSADLASKHKGRRTKEERMATVLEGREGREFGAAAGRKKAKTGGLSNKQKAKMKMMPAPARAQQLKRRSNGKQRGAAAKKAQRGHTGAAAYGRSGAGRKK